MLSNRVKYRIAANKRARRQLWYLRRKYGLNRALWPSTWTIWYNSLAERAADVFGETFYPTIAFKTVERNEEIQAIMRLPKAIDFPGLRGRRPAPNPLHFGKMDWKPELKMMIWTNGQPSWSTTGKKELVVKPSHRHHHWPQWAYEPDIAHLTELYVNHFAPDAVEHLRDVGPGPIKPII